MPAEIMMPPRTSIASMPLLFTAGVELEAAVVSEGEDIAIASVMCGVDIVMTVPSAMTCVTGAEVWDELPRGAMHTA
jgi:hypothetical protein